MQVCPSCKRNQKNLILHIEKSNKCKDNVSEEDMKMLKDQSEMQRKQYMRKLMKERRRKAKVFGSARTSGTGSVSKSGNSNENTNSNSV